LKHRVIGFDKKIDIDSFVIDEAQDFSVFQFYALKEILNTNKITLLGDIAQGIHSYRGIKNWQEVIDSVFQNKSSYMTLVQSYRTTIEIMELANEVIKKLNDSEIVIAKPVIRHGEKATYKTFNNELLLLDELQSRIEEMIKEEYKSIAIICKTKDECLKVKKYLDKYKEVSSKVLDDKEEVYEAGVVLVPSHLAKGLEFDVVLIANIDEEYLETELDIKLLYVAMTRTLHRLFIYCIEGKISILNDIRKELLI